MMNILIGRKVNKSLLLCLIMLSMLVPLFTYVNVTAETVPVTQPKTKNYSIVIANQEGEYTFYDLNEGNGEAQIEVSSTGNIMVPLKKLCSLMPSITYSYNSKKKEATVTNTLNGKKAVYKKNSKYCYYINENSKSTKKTMSYKMYVSNNTSSVMVHMSSLKWVMGTTKGYHYYKVKDMQSAGYINPQIDGLIAYNPYADTAIPEATVRVTIPEGYAVAQIFDLLVSKGVCVTSDSLYNTMENYDFSYYPLVKEIEENENRCFKLEGYLFPDTYQFYRFSKSQDVIGKFLRNTEAKITIEDRDKAESLGYTVDEILTIASLTQKEIGDAEQMPLVSSVIFNRLEISMKLELDAAVYYVERYIKPYIDGDINRYNSYYNTGKCAFPAGPICNPGKDAIWAALNPAETTNLFFYSDKEGIYHFSENWVKATD